MAAYAALLSLMHTINDLQCHPQPPISLHPKHLISLTQTLAFLQDFLERYSTEEDEHLERRITAAAHAAEDVIETYIVNLIESGSTNHDISFVDFDGDLERAIQALDLIKGEAMEISETKNKGSQHHQLHANSSATPAAWQSSSSIVVIDYALVLEVLDKLVVQQSKLQIIPIVGMGGIGKTTFATNIYSQQLIVEHFDILAWVEISQECSGSKILSQVLGQQNKGNDDDELDKLGLRAYQRLFGMRYLIVMDDIWSYELWDKVKIFFPDNNNGSRIVITTRLSNLANKLSGSHVLQLSFLNEEKSWDMLCEIVFGKELGCPNELVSVGKEIARNHQLQINSSVRMQSKTIAEFDDSLMNEVLDKLTGQKCSLQIISIVGMGGIGKTTLARNIYLSPLILQHFDILAWVTISQECSGTEILLQVLCENSKGSEMDENKLGDRVHKKLWGRRFLIVMDDIWSIQPWDRVKFFFPDNDNGSRIMITTRLSKLALNLSGSHIFQLSFLDVEKSWDLLCKIVFGKELGCPVELVSIGREIARNCRGLPLSLVVMGGLLKRTSMTKVNWRYILENLNSLINLDDDEYCLHILGASY